jgi:hypothetical protein
MQKILHLYIGNRVLYKFTVDLPFYRNYLTPFTRFFYADVCAQGRIQSAERAVPTLAKKPIHELSFSLIRADPQA